MSGSIPPNYNNLPPELKALILAQLARGGISGVLAARELTSFNREHHAIGHSLVMRSMLGGHTLPQELALQNAVAITRLHDFSSANEFFGFTWGPEMTSVDSDELHNLTSKLPFLREAVASSRGWPEARNALQGVAATLLQCHAVLVERNEDGQYNDLAGEVMALALQIEENAAVPAPAPGSADGGGSSTS